MIPTERVTTSPFRREIERGTLFRRQRFVSTECDTKFPTIIPHARTISANTTFGRNETSANEVADPARTMPEDRPPTRLSARPPQSQGATPYSGNPPNAGDAGMRGCNAGYSYRRPQDRRSSSSTPEYPPGSLRGMQPPFPSSKKPTDRNDCASGQGCERSEPRPAVRGKRLTYTP